MNYYNPSNRSSEYLNIMKYFEGNSSSTNEELYNYLRIHNRTQTYHHFDGNRFEDKSIRRSKHTSSASQFMKSNSVEKSFWSKKSLPNQPMLKKAEQKIFREVMALIASINQIQLNITEQERKLNQLDSIINNQSSNAYLTQNGKQIKKIREYLTIKKTQINKIAQQNQKLQKQISIQQILNRGDLSNQLNDQMQIKQQLNRKKAQISKSLRNHQTAKMTIAELQLQIQSIQTEKECISNSIRNHQKMVQIDKQLESAIQLEFKSKELLTTLKKRLELQTFIIGEEDQKVAFFEELKKFKAEYSEAKSQNARLKQLINSTPQLRDAIKGDSIREGDSLRSIVTQIE